MNFISNEIVTGLTNVTIALLAFDMGQTERANLALLRAQEAKTEARRAISTLRFIRRRQALARMRLLTEALKEVNDRNHTFSSSLRQPSLN